MYSSQRSFHSQSASTWQDYFAKEWDRREPETDNPFRLDSSVALATTPESTGPVSSFFDLPMETRLTLLNALCEVKTRGTRSQDG